MEEAKKIVDLYLVAFKSNISEYECPFLNLTKKNSYLRKKGV